MSRQTNDVSEHLSEKERELAALGASIGCNCVPCIVYHIAKARQCGLTDHQIRDAVELARRVRDVPANQVLSTALAQLEPDETPGVSRIRNTNSSQLWAQTLRAGAQPAYYGIARDTDGETDALIRRAGRENDLILLSGGVSMGDYDLVPAYSGTSASGSWWRRWPCNPASRSDSRWATAASASGCPGIRSPRSRSSS